MDQFSTHNDLFADAFTFSGSRMFEENAFPQSSSSMFHQEPDITLASVSSSNMFQDDFLAPQSGISSEAQADAQSTAQIAPPIQQTTEARENAAVLTISQLVAPDSSAESEQKAEVKPELEVPDLEPMTTVNNVVCSFATRCHLNLPRLKHPC